MPQEQDETILVSCLPLILLIKVVDMSKAA